MNRKLVMFLPGARDNGNGKVIGFGVIIDYNPKLESDRKGSYVTYHHSTECCWFYYGDGNARTPTEYQHMYHFKA